MDLEFGEKRAREMEDEREMERKFAGFIHMYFPSI